MPESKPKDLKLSLKIDPDAWESALSAASKSLDMFGRIMDSKIYKPAKETSLKNTSRCVYLAFDTTRSMWYISWWKDPQWRPISEDNRIKVSVSIEEERELRKIKVLIRIPEDTIREKGIIYFYCGRHMVGAVDTPVHPAVGGYADFAYVYRINYRLVTQFENECKRMLQDGPILGEQDQVEEANESLIKANESLIKQSWGPPITSKRKPKRPSR